MSESVFGIDLGTTNSEIALVDEDGQAVVLSFENEQIMPSVVGTSPSGSVLVGTPAKNQYGAYPEKTIRSVKRFMGTPEIFSVGTEKLSPEAVSALILRELARRAKNVTGSEVRRVVITVPAFFKEAQRQATRRAGEIAGLEVVRIVNEPTAAALAFEGVTSAERTLMVFDLGGGTFDVSIIRTDGEVTEILSSHGDNQLGGDDFDRALVDACAERAISGGGRDPRKDPESAARLLEAAELAKKRLSVETGTRVREEFIGGGESAHLDLTLTRTEFEERTVHLIERCLNCVHNALGAANLNARDLDDVLLVGGATRMPMIAARLEEATGLRPRRDVHPDLCVAQGAALLGARVEGRDVQRVLLDITPYSFGVEVIGEGDEYGVMAVVIDRGTPLPVTRSIPLYTTHDHQEWWNCMVYQGENRSVEDNTLIGEFRASISKARAGHEITCRMRLDLDGLLAVEAVDSKTDEITKATIDGVTDDAQRVELDAEREATARLLDEDEGGGEETTEQKGEAIEVRARAAIERGKGLAGRMVAEDREAYKRLEKSLEKAMGVKDGVRVLAILDDIEDLFYYVEAE